MARLSWPTHRLLDFSERRLEPRSTVRTIRILSNRPRPLAFIPVPLGGCKSAGRWESAGWKSLSLLERHFVHASITN